MRNRVALADSPEYNHYRAAVLKFLYERQRNPESNSGSGKQINAIDVEEDKPLHVVASVAAA
jgi:nitrate/nitrite transport system ATP-binding protein